MNGLKNKVCLLMKALLCEMLASVSCEDCCVCGSQHAPNCFHCCSSNYHIVPMFNELINCCSWMKLSASVDGCLVDGCL